MGDALRDLGDGLVLRRGSRADTEPLVAFVTKVFGAGASATHDERLTAWTRDLMERPHPTFLPGDFVITEDTRTGAIVSITNLISQTWSYAGVPVPVGRPEYVGTDPAYRDRGLVREQFAVIHRWSAERGELAQVISGIPYFYRQFGYEPVVDLGGGQVCGLRHIPRLAEGATETYRLRPAGQADLGLIARAGERSECRYALTCHRDGALWAYELNGRDERNVNRQALQVIETAAGRAIGYVAHSPWVDDGLLGVRAYELDDGATWVDATPSVLRALGRVGEALARGHQGGAFTGLALGLGADHPAYHVVDGLVQQPRSSSSWYARIEDLPAFLRHVTPVLERRLAGSLMAGYTGDLKISQYRGGVRLSFAAGFLAEVAAWRPGGSDRGHCAFPGLTFIQLLCGRRDLAELEHVFPDCWAAGSSVRLLLAALFPRQASSIWQVS